MKLEEIREAQERVEHASSTRALARDIVMYAKSVADKNSIDITTDKGYQVWEGLLRRHLLDSIKTLGDYVLEKRIDVEYLAGQEGRAREIEEIYDPSGSMSDIDRNVIYKVFVNTHGDPEDSWATNAMKYDTVEAAKAAAENLFDRWTAVKYWRVMDSEQQTVYAEGP